MKDKNTLVGVILGSDSDYEIIKPCFEILRDFEIQYEAHIISAHRTPDKAIGYSRLAKKNGIKVIIAVAGAAAHLAGVLASSTTLPVIGIPISSTSLNGLDALLSTVQMPGGVPVATVALDGAGAKNAAILAVQILAINDKKLTKKLENFKTEIRDKVNIKTQKLQTQIREEFRTK